jgi:hypothetical protein
MSFLCAPSAFNPLTLTSDPRLATNFSVNPTKVPHFLAIHYKQTKYSLSKSVTLPIPNLLS